jgi:2-polyprenyl-3-methyl-5-hydroxy-6-metoxy-1,4-benzoquinol methylase
MYGRHYYDAWGLGAAEKRVRKLKMSSFGKLLIKVRMDIPPGGRILDVGCATGYFLEAAREMGFEPFGVELSYYGAEVCRSKFGAGRIHEGSLETAVFKDCPEDRVDAIFMSDLLEHVSDPPATLKTARRWLPRGGRLLITTPDIGSWSHRVFGRHWLHYKPEHLFYFGTNSLGRLLTGAGFGATIYWTASKCLSLRYAKHQLAAFGVIGERIDRWVERLPAGILDRKLSVRLGEVTAMATAV